MNPRLNKGRGVTLTELLIAIVLLSVVILAATSVDITSRRFFSSIEKGSQVQDEAKIALAHIVKNVQLGVGYIDEPGFSILGGGSRIQVKQDSLTGPNSRNGRYDAGDPFIEYEYNSTQHTIRFYPDANNRNNFELLAKGIVESAVFSSDVANRVNVKIVVRKDLNNSPSLENPETTLTSSIVLRAMSAN